MQVFISYRRSDAPSAASRLDEALKARFGAAQVFFDTDVPAGADWRRDVVLRVRGSDVVLVVIGRHFAAAAAEHASRAVLDPAAEDLVRLEIETALTSGREIIPLLVDDAVMPARESLPRPFRPLANVQAQTLHHASWDRDFEILVDILNDLPARSRPNEAPAVPPPAGPGRSDAARIARYIAEGSVVTVVGPGANAVDRTGPWRHGTGSLPDAAELARQLVSRFGVGSETDDLARISQYVTLLDGKVDLYRALRELLIKTDCEPGSVHRFLARIPARLRDIGEERYELLVTTNYDTALERAFDVVHEPYDLAVFVASGEHSGRFVHVPWDDRSAEPILVPNEYVDLPIDEDGTLDRTVIVKLHGGGVDPRNCASQLRDTFVITEDDYIGYLTHGPVESLVPLQILNKIRESHFLFLGYRVHDWTLRVFLQRIWGDEQLESRSWAVDPGRDLLEHELWDDLGVDVIEKPLGAFLEDVEHELGGLSRAPER